MNSLAPSYRICWSLWILSSEIWISFTRDHQTVHPDGPNSPDCFESIQHRSDVIPVPDFLHRFFFKVSALLNGTFSSTTFPFLSLIDLLSIYYKLYHFLFYWLLLAPSGWTKFTSGRSEFAGSCSSDTNVTYIVTIMRQIMIKSLYKSSNCQIKRLIEND